MSLSGGQEKLKLTKLTDSEDIEAYLTTFERMMQVYEVEEDRWAFKLAPQLTGKAQQAYASLKEEDARNYAEVKAAILRRYDINEETYRQRFRATRRKDGESYMELVIRLQDLFKKWIAGSKDIEEVCEKVVVEQLLNTMPSDLRIWIRERKPATGAEAGNLADNYLQARRREGVGLGKSSQETSKYGREGVGLGRSSQESGKCGLGRINQESGKQGKGAGEMRSCHICGVVGHIAPNCPKKQPGKEGNGRTMKCFNCGKKGHMAVQCPDKALFCGEKLGGVVTCKGKVEGRDVGDILLDTGCSRTMVRRSLVPEERSLEGQAVTIQCAHGDVALYPLAQVELEVEGEKVQVQAAVSDNLPVSVLLGTDVPKLKKLLRANSNNLQTIGMDAALVMTRSQVKEKERAEAEMSAKERRSGVEPNPVEESENGGIGSGERSDEESGKQFGCETEDIEESGKQCETEDILGSSFSDDLFRRKNLRVRKTRRQKREARKVHGLIRAKDRSGKSRVRDKKDWESIVSRAELEQLQREDESLAEVRKACEEGVVKRGRKYLWRDGLLYCRHRESGSEVEMEQIVLPWKCRKTVLHLAHTVPTAGHLGRKKTASRILSRFYWPTLFKDVADFCRSCQNCQKYTHKRAKKAPLISLPIMSEPFERMAMDIIGPLPRSRSGCCYVLVLCDYATRYPEAVALKSIDAETIAEELIKVFARVGIPKELLTDQGTNFTSQLLAEVYRLLHVKALRTTPYHPQTDGLVERFNKTLKEMLRKTADEEGKDWDKLLPFVLFAYREVPQESTGYSPFELLYGREVRGPLDVMRESWETPQNVEEGVLSYVLSMREKFEQMELLVQSNMRRAQRFQKQWYDKGAKQRQLQVGDYVLVLLPTSTSKFTAQWQGPYLVLKKVGKVNYLVDMGDRKKRKRVFHVNMLKKWQIQESMGYLMKEVEDEENEDEIPTWDGGEDGKPRLGEQLTDVQKKELGDLLRKYDSVLQKFPGETKLAVHSINTGDTLPIRLPTYRIPYAYRAKVEEEIKEMLTQGIITPSSSNWAAPMVLVKKKDDTLRICVDYRKLNSGTKSMHILCPE